MQVGSLLSVAIFLDTNVLDPLPETLESGSLQGLVSDAKSLGLTVYLPDIVAREWVQHRLEEAVKSITRAVDCVERLGQYSEQWLQMELPSPKIIRETIESKARERLAGSGLVVLDPPHVDMAEISDRAVRGSPPFKNGDRGFKDELLVRTVLELVRKEKYMSVMLVSKDKVFLDEIIRSRFKPHNIQFMCVQNLEDAAGKLKVALSEEVRRIRQERQERVRKLAETKWQQIEKAVIEKVKSEGVARYQLFEEDRLPPMSTMRKILEVRPQKIASLDVGPTHEGTHQARVTLGVSCQLKVEVEYYDLGAFLGGRVYMEDAPRRPNRLGPVLGEAPMERTVFLEAKVRQEGENWSELELVAPSGPDLGEVIGTTTTTEAPSSS